jgi:DNA repair exonuclease SbcCD nuclease subunit
MKIALINDTHWGVRGDSQVLLDHQEKFFTNIFFPELEKRNITTIIHLGDLVDRRKYINFYTASRLKTDFLDKLDEYDVHILAGNHDTYYKTTNELNALEQLVDTNTRLSVYTEVSEIWLGSSSVLLVPWINPENAQASLDAINNTASQIVFGHLEIQGFEMALGSYCDHGFDRSTFAKFDMVMSGHFHSKSHQDNIYYLGAPFQMTWSDYQGEKGFHIFDTITRELEFVPNPYKLFHKLYYHDADKTFEEVIQPLKETNVSDCYVKLIVEEKNNPYWFNRFTNTLEKMGPYDLGIVEALTFHEFDDTIIETEDTETILLKSIDNLDVSCDKKKLKRLLSNLYKDALDMETDEFDHHT